MKGVIALALKELVIENFGQDKWNQALQKAGIDQEPLILPITDLEDGLVGKVLGAVCEVLNLTAEQAADAFGDYWVNTYAQKIYASYFRTAPTAKDFLLQMDTVHSSMTSKMAGARPPRFEYEQPDDKTLIIRYRSHRGMFHIMVGLVKGVGKHYGEKLTLTPKGDDALEVVFG